MSEVQKNDARQLRKLNFDLANYFFNTIIPQLFVDADLVLRIFTPPAMKQFSLSYDDIGKNIDDVKDNIRYSTIVENIREVITSNNILEKEVQTTDGNWFQMNILPYVEQETNEANGVIITFVDITKRLATLKELEKLNSDHETLMFALSHDIRQPISSMMLLADTLLMAHNKNNSEQFEKGIRALKSSARSLESVVQDFTTNRVRKQENGNGEVRMNIERIVEDVLLSLREEIKTEKIQVNTNFTVSELDFPRNNLRSIVYNLLHNAIKFSDPEKKKKIVAIATESVKGFTIFCVSDNGIGIEEGHQKKVFEKSSRIHQEIKGTGMGLYVVKKMVEGNNGRIKLESRSGEGSTFKVFFKSDN